MRFLDRRTIVFITFSIFKSEVFGLDGQSAAVCASPFHTENMCVTISRRWTAFMFAWYFDNFRLNHKSLSLHYYSWLQPNGINSSASKDYYVLNVSVDALKRKICKQQIASIAFIMSPLSSSLSLFVFISLCHTHTHTYSLSHTYSPTNSNQMKSGNGKCQCQALANKETWFSSKI